MKAVVFKKSLILFVLAAFLLQVSAPSASEARWRSHYDDLPGEDVSVGKILLIGAGVAAAIVVITLAVKSGKKNESAEEGTNTPDDEKIEDSDEASFYGKGISRAVENISFDSVKKPYCSFYLDLDKADKTGAVKNADFDFSNVMLKAGFSYNF